MKNLIEQLKDVGDLIDSGQIDKAYSDLDDLITEYPTREEPLIVASQHSLEIHQVEKAKNYIKKAVSINPNNIETLKFAGFIYNTTSEHDDALEYFSKCVSLGCKDSDLLLKQANSYVKLYKPAQAKLILDHLRLIRKITPDGLIDLATCVQYMNQGIEEAIKYCMEAIKMDPNEINAHMKLGEFMSIIGESSAASKCYLSIAKKMVGRDYLKFSDNYSNYLLSINYHDDQDIKYKFREHIKYSDLLGEISIKNKSNKLDVNKRLRIGFVSADLNTHPIYFFLYPLLKYLDKDSFEIHIFSNMHRGEDIATERYREIVFKWNSIQHLPDYPARDLILKSEIDILIDLSGHTGNNRLPLFALRSAPIQISWLGYPNTTGLKNMDYRIVDEITDPSPHYDKLATETLIRIDPCFLCYTPYDSIDSLGFNPKPKTDELIFCCYNNLAKINPELISAWSIILNNTPNSKLLIKSRFSQEKDTKSYILRKFSDNGIHQDKIKIVNIYSNYGEHMHSFNNVDISLDPFPYNGTSSTCESLFMGVPVITRKGNCHASRVSSSLLSCINHNELITNNTDEYITTCIDLACDINRLNILKNEIRHDILKSPLMNKKLFADQFASLLYSLIQ